MRQFFCLVLALFSTKAVADSWIPATKQVYEAPDKSARITVVPRNIRSPLAYFQDKVDGREPAGASIDSTATTASAILEVQAGGRWVSSWAKPLVNEVAPVDVLISSAGQRVVTFDNWHSMGYGPYAIVVYDAQGNVIRTLGLEDVFPKWFAAALPHSVSSIWWRGDPRISGDGTAAIIPIKIPSNDPKAGVDGLTLDLRIRLSDGEPTGLTEQPWKAALIQAAETARSMCRAERAYITKWNSPISAPSEWNEPAWHEYLREIIYRSIPASTDDDGPIVSTTVLRPPSEKDFSTSAQWLKEAVTEKVEFADEDIRAIGSPDYERLTQEIEKVTARIGTDRLKGAQLVIVVDELHSAQVQSALSRTGAKLRIVDPREQLPQRSERIRAAGEEPQVCLASQSN